MLGSIILEPEAVPQVVDFLRPEDFYRDAHRQIYAAVIDLHHDHTPADLITLWEEFDRRGQLKDIGGAASVSSLVNAVPTSANVEYYGRIVERASMMRRLVHAGGQMAALAYTEKDARVALEQSMHLLLEISARHQDNQEQDFEEVLDELLEETYNRMEGTVSQHLLQTGLPALNAAASGMDRGGQAPQADRPRPEPAHPVPGAVQPEVEYRHGLAEKRPILPDFRYSGRLEQDADQGWFVFRPSMCEARPQEPHWSEYGEIILGKMRDGQRGLIVPYRFVEPYALIEAWPSEWERPVVE